MFNSQKSYHKTLSSADAGFTLIELSIALVVIGLIMGGLMMKGKNLIEATRLNNVLTQVEEIKQAILMFQNEFNALPGAYSRAKENISDKLENGQSNNTVEGDGLDLNTEAGQFWAHLAAANLIPDIGSVNESEMNFGSGAPSAKIGGGFTVQNNPSDTMSGLWLVLGSKNGKKGNGALLTPLQAMQLDQKADNGNPTTGHIRALGDECLTQQGTYNTKLNKPVCALYFKL